jgi:RNA polymerase sigma factor (sigma-70 family)
MDGFGQPLESSPASESAAESLFRRYHRWLTAVLRRRYGREEAEDLMQETYMRMVRAGDAGAVGNPRGLLMRVAQNAATDRYRRSRREREAATEVADIEAFGNLADQHDKLLLRQIVLALPPKLRDVFVLNQMEGLSHPEIARLLGIHVKTVEWRMRKAMVLCAKAMKD